MPAPSVAAESSSVWAALLYVLRRPWITFVINWNWKAGLLSGLFRALLFLIALRPAGLGAMRTVYIELAVRVLTGGAWGSLLQAFRGARPAWLAGVSVAVFLPAGVHILEYSALRAGHGTHIRSAMIASIALSAASLILNWSLMRKGLLLTGTGADTLGADLRRMPRALVDFWLTASRTISQVLPRRYPSS